MLKELFNSEIFQKKKLLQNRPVFELEEEKEDQKISFLNAPEDAYLIKLDIDKEGFKQRSAYFNPSTKNIHKGCDYVLIDEDSKTILLIELKGTRIKKAAEQLAVSKAFIDYIISLDKLITNKSVQYTFKYMCISRRFAHETTRRDKYLSNNYTVFKHELIKIIETAMSPNCSINYDKLT